MAVRVTRTGSPLTRRVRREADINDLPAVREVMAGLKKRAKSSKNHVKGIAAECAEILQEKGIDPDPQARLKPLRPLAMSTLHLIGM